MKKGDLVKMTFVSFWHKKNNRYGAPVPYTESPLLVIEKTRNAVQVMLPDGRIKRDLAEYYEVINE